MEINDKFENLIDKIDRPKCTSNQFCSELCTRKNCTVPAIMCAKQTFLKSRCDCHKVHYESKCSYRKFEDVICHVSKSKKRLNLDQQKVLDSIQQKINDTINILKDENDKFNRWRQKLGHTKLAKQLIQKLENKKYPEITGDFIYKLYKELNYNQELKNKNMIDLKTNMIQVSGTLDKLVKNIRQLYHSLENSQQNPIVLKMEELEEEENAAQNQTQLELNPPHSNRITILRQQPSQFKWSESLRAKKIKIIDNIVIQQNQILEEYYENTFILLQPPLKHLQKFRIKVIKNEFQIYVGICLKSRMQKQNFSFTKYNSIKHGTYLFGSRGFCYSNHDISINNKKHKNGLPIKQNDIVEVTLDLNRAVVIFKLNNNEKALIQLQIKRRRQNYEPYFGCVYLGQKGESVQLLTKQKDIYQIKRQEARH